MYKDVSFISMMIIIMYYKHVLMPLIINTLYKVLILFLYAVKVTFSYSYVRLETLSKFYIECVIFSAPFQMQESAYAISQFLTNYSTSI